MRCASVSVSGRASGILEERAGGQYRFTYLEAYDGPPISIVMPISQRVYDFQGFPPFFDGLLPEGFQLEALLKIRKLDRDDCFAQLMSVGHDLVGDVTVEEIR